MMDITLNKDSVKLMADQVKVLNAYSYLISEQYNVIIELMNEIDYLQGRISVLEKKEED